MAFENLAQQIGQQSNAMLQAAIAGREASLKERQMKQQMPMGLANTFASALQQYQQMEMQKQQMAAQQKQQAFMQQMQGAQFEQGRTEFDALQEHRANQADAATAAAEAKAVTHDLDYRRDDFDKGVKFFEVALAKNRQLQAGVNEQGISIGGDGGGTLDMGQIVKEQEAILSARAQWQQYVEQAGGPEMAEPGVYLNILQEQLDGASPASIPEPGAESPALNLLRDPWNAEQMGALGGDIDLSGLPGF